MRGGAALRVSGDITDAGVEVTVFARGKHDSVAAARHCRGWMFPSWGQFLTFVYPEKVRWAHVGFCVTLQQHTFTFAKYHQSLSTVGKQTPPLKTVGVQCLAWGEQLFFPSPAKIFSAVWLISNQNLLFDETAPINIYLLTFQQRDETMEKSVSSQ